MRLREQASLWCKVLGILCVVLGLNSVPPLLSQFFTLGRMGSASLNLASFIGLSSPLIVMGVVGAVIWFLSPFLAALMIPDATVQKLESPTENETVSQQSTHFGGREALTCAMILLGLWMWFTSASGVGRASALDTAMRVQTQGSPNAMASMAQYYNYQLNTELLVAAIQFVLGALLLVSAKFVARRVFPLS